VEIELLSHLDFDIKSWYGFCEMEVCMRKLSVEQEEQIVVEYLKGDMNTKEIAFSFGVSDTTVRNILKRHDIIPYKRNVMITRDVENQMIEMYKFGFNLEEVAKKFGFVKSTPLKVLKRRGVKPRKMIRRKILSFDQRKELSQQYINGDTFNILQEKYGVSDSVVKSCLDEFGVKPRTAWGRFRTKKWIDINDRAFIFKSNWELLYAGWLDKKGFEWDYEPHKFGLRRCNCYTPDFRIKKDDVIEYHEVKGWLDDMTCNRIEEFMEMYPDKILKIIGPKDMVNLGLIGSEYVNHPMSNKVFRFQQKALTS
jgi:hypothetical protein